MSEFTPKYLAFLKLGHFREPFKIRESDFHDLLNLDYSQVVYVSLSELKGKLDFRFMGVTPPQCCDKTEYYKNRLKRHKEVFKTNEIKFNYGLYYNPDALLLVDDIIEYNHSHRKFKDIRTARRLHEDLNPTNK